MMHGNTKLKNTNNYSVIGYDVMLTQGKPLTYFSLLASSREVFNKEKYISG